MELTVNSDCCSQLSKNIPLLVTISYLIFPLSNCCGDDPHGLKTSRANRRFFAMGTGPCGGSPWVSGCGSSWNSADFAAMLWKSWAALGSPGHWCPSSCHVESQLSWQAPSSQAMLYGWKWSSKYIQNHQRMAHHWSLGWLMGPWKMDLVNPGVISMTRAFL